MNGPIVIFVLRTSAVLTEAVNGTSVMSCHHKVGAQIVKDAIKDLSLSLSNRGGRFSRDTRTTLQETFGEQKHGSEDA